MENVTAESLRWFLTQPIPMWVLLLDTVIYIVCGMLAGYAAGYTGGRNYERRRGR